MTGNYQKGVFDGLRAGKEVGLCEMAVFFLFVRGCKTALMNGFIVY
jgi:hypothetical protein